MYLVGSIIILVFVLAAFIVSRVLTTKGNKAFANGPKDRKSYNAFLGGTASIALIVVGGILIVSQFVSLILNEVLHTSGSISQMIYLITEHNISFTSALANGLLDGLIEIISNISMLASLIIIGVMLLVAGKTGKKPFIIVAVVFLALYLLDRASGLMRDFISGYKYFSHTALAADDFFGIYQGFGMALSLIGAGLGLAAAITTALSIKGVVKTGVVKLKGFTIAFAIVTIVGIPVLSSLVYTMLSIFDLIYNETPFFMAPPSSIENLLMTLAYEFAIVFPIIALFRAGNAISDEALKAEAEETKKETAPTKPAATSTETVKASAPVVVKPVEEVKTSASAPKASSSQSSSEPVWREKKDASGKPVDASGKVIEQFATNRGIVKFFFLSLITFSIYGLVIMCKVTGELRKVREGHGKDKPLPFFAMLVLTPLTLGIVTLVWNHKMAKRLQEECEYRGIASPIKPWQFWVFAILLSELLFFPFYYQAKLFIASNQINAHHNKYGDKKVRVVVKTAAPKPVEAKPVETVKPVEKVAPTPAAVVDAKPVEETKPTVSEPASTTEAPKPETSKVDPMEKLKKAKAMLDAGLITQEEYDEVKAKALADL